MTSTPPKMRQIETHNTSTLTPTTLASAATLFSQNYGIWGPLAATKTNNPNLKPGRRIKMSANYLKNKLIPSSPKARNIYVRMSVDGKLIGHVFATWWDYQGRRVCWVSQLVVRADSRRKGVATGMLRALRNSELCGSDGKGMGEENGFVVGILSSHPAALKATIRAFGGNINNSFHLDQKLLKSEARDIMISSPVEYVRDASMKLRAVDG